MQVARDTDARDVDEKEIDLRHYVDILVRRRRVIGTVMLLVTLWSVFSSFASPPGYKANATVAIIKAKTDVAFGSGLETVSDEDLAAAGTRQVFDADARRAALEGLVKNSTVATKVIARLGDQLTAAQRNPARLLANVDATIVEQGDLIEISFTDAVPERAARIANAWAVEYERLVNSLYSGAPIELSDEVGAELKRAGEEARTAQAVVEAFIENNQVDTLTRQIAEKKVVLDQLQLGKTMALSMTIEGQLNAQQQVIDAYYEAQSASKLLLFNKQQEAKRAALAAYIDAEVQNRMAAFNRDRNLRLKTFESFVTAEISGTLAVIDEQVTDKTATLSRYYAEKTNIARLLDNARTMRAQINEGGNAAAASNTLALLLLKFQAFTPGDELELPADLQLQVADQVPATAGAQIADLDAIISVLEQRQADVEQNVQELSNELLAGTGYDFLDDISAPPLSLGTTPGVTATQAVSESLAINIARRYQELFEVGPLATEAQNIATDTQLFNQIKKLYPDLFTTDPLMELTETLPQDTSLSQAADERARELLNLGELENLPSFSAASEKLAQATDKLQNEIRELEVQKERESVKQADLVQRRDLAAEVYTTLLRKQTELGVAAALTGSEVRVASPAVPPYRREQSRLRLALLSMILGLLLGTIVAAVLHFLYPHTTPHLRIGQPSAVWNRALRWLLTPASGLSTQVPSDRAMPA